MHALPPFKEWWNPTAHLAHAEATLLPDAATKCPAKHLSHSVCPSESWVVPEAHLVHADAWAALEYRPALQLVHADWSVTPW